MTLLMMRVSSLVFKETSGKSVVVVVVNVVLDFLEELEATLALPAAALSLLLCEVLLLLLLLLRWTKIALRCGFC